MMLVIRVEGTTPVPQGSKTAFVVKGSSRAIVVDANAKDLKPWREMVAAVAADAVSEKGWQVLQDGAIAVNADFIFPRPKAHFRANGTLKDSAPHYKPTKPDVDKLVRSLLDSLTGVVFRDDSQVVKVDAGKRYVGHDEHPGMNVVCYTL